MRDYLAAFDRSFIGATGAPERWPRCAQDYGVTAVKAGTGPTMRWPTPRRSS
jgi:protein SCO1/2